MTTYHRIHLSNTDDHYRCAEDLDVLRAMEALGRRGIPVGCRGGGCGICKVRVTEGDYDARKMSRAYISAEDEQAGVVLACRVFPRGNLKLEAVDQLARCLQRAAGLALREQGEGGMPGRGSAADE